MTGRQHNPGAIAVVALAALALLIVAVPFPVWWLISTSDAPALVDVLREPGLHSALLRSLGIALAACLLASLIALPLASVLARRFGPSLSLVAPFGVLPILLPPFVTAALLQQVLASLGLSTITLPGWLPLRDSLDWLLVVSLAVHFFPLITLTLMLGLRDIDRGLEDSARNLGSGTWQTWRHVVLPLAAPGYLLGAVIVVLRILDEAGAPLVLGIDDLLAPRIVAEAVQHRGDAGTLAPALLMLAATALIAALTWNAVRPAGVFRATRCATAARRQGPLTRALGGGLLAAGLALAVAPGGMLLALWMANAVLPPVSEALPGFVLAVATGLACALLGLLFGAAGTAAGSAGALVRGVVPLVWTVPGILLALAYARGLPVLPLESETAAWLALALVVLLKLLPIGALLVSVPLRAVGGSVGDSARSLGASSAGIWLGPGAVALGGPLLTLFALGAAGLLNELTGALLLFPERPGPLTQQAFELARTGGDWLPAAAAVFLAAVLLALLAATWLGPRWCRRGNRGLDPEPSLGEIG